MAALPDVGRATAVERQPIAPEATATQSLYERYATQVYGFCLNQLGNREEAEDAVQSTFMNAFRGLQRGVVPEAEAAWLFKIAHNVCLSRRRANWRRGRVEFANDLDALQEVTPTPHGRSADDLIRLNDVLARMPESQRKAILLREWQGLSYHEIGQEMELSQSAVETLIFRARRSLAQGLETAEQHRPKGRLRRLRQSANLGSMLATLKSLLAGGAAIKTGAAAIVVAGAALTAAEPARHSATSHHARRAAPATSAPATVAPSFVDRPDAAAVSAAPKGVTSNEETARPAPSRPHTVPRVHTRPDAPAPAGTPAPEPPAATASTPSVAPAAAPEDVEPPRASDESATSPQQTQNPRRTQQPPAATGSSDETKNDNGKDAPPPAPVAFSPPEQSHGNADRHAKTDEAPSPSDSAPGQQKEKDKAKDAPGAADAAQGKQNNGNGTDAQKQGGSGGNGNGNGGRDRGPKTP